MIPSILAILGGNISIMVDNCVAGAVMGENALAAMGLVNPIFNAITAFGLLICGGASALASVNIGLGDDQKKRNYFSLAFYLLLAVAAIVTTLGFVFLEPIVKAVGAEGELLPLAKDYARIIFLSSIALMSVYFPLNFFRIEGKAKISMIMFFIMATLDIILDLVFVLVFDWGMTGLALATGLSSLIAVIVVLPRLFSPALGYRLTKVSSATGEIKKVITTGSPLALGNLYTVIRVRILNALLLSCGGSLALAAYGCANSVNNIGMAIVSGFSQTVGPIVGVLYGERDRDGIQKTVKRALKLGSAVTLILWLLCVVSRQQLAALFGMSSLEQTAAAGLAISILNFNLLFTLIVNVFIYYYMTTDHPGLSNLLTFSKGLICNVLLAFIGAKLFGFTGLLAGLALSEMVCILVAFIAASAEKKKKHCDSVLLLPEHLFNNGDFLSRTILPTSESISETAELAGDFCSEHGLPPKQAMTVSLGIEEIMVLMQQHAVTKEDDCLDFRLFISEYETILRLRCAGKWFNPLNYESEDEMDNLGAKMLIKMATDISYSTNLGLNNIKLTIKRKETEEEKQK